MRVEAGKYLTDKVYLGYQFQIDADEAKGENTHAAKLEVQVTPRWSLEASFGTAESGGADMIWSRDF